MTIWHDSCIFRIGDGISLSPVPEDCHPKSVGDEVELPTKRAEMDPKPETSLNKHFHIRWSHIAALDWERFDTVEEATARALELVRPGEKFTIEESQAKCSRCGEMASLIGDEQDSISS